MRTQPKKPIPADVKFGTLFTDHMVSARFDVHGSVHGSSGGWSEPELSAYQKISLDPSASVLHYGQAIFEGLKAFETADGGIALFRPDRHAKRFQASADRTCMPQVPTELFVECVKKLVRADEGFVPDLPDASLYVRPTLIATEPFVGVRPAHQYLFFVIACPVGPYYAEGFKPIKIWVEEEFTRAAPGGLGAAKVGANYVASLLAAERAKDAGYSQVLWTDAVSHKYLEEVGTMNVFVRIGDQVITPPAGNTTLAGVTRDSVLQLLRDWKIDAQERPITVDELLAASRSGQLREMFGTGTAAVISPVGTLGFRGETLHIGDGQAGELSQRLFKALRDIQRGTAADPYGWLHRVV
jgi:branched-chain amino acid aminotransferase